MLLEPANHTRFIAGNELQVERRQGRLIGERDTANWTGPARRVADRQNACSSK